MSGSDDVWLKKPQMIRYSYNFNQELNRLLGAYAFFITNRQYERAFWNLYNAALHVRKDPQLRLFAIATNSFEEQKKVLTEFMVLFELFKGVFIGPSPDRKFSYMELRPRLKPDPGENTIFIGRRVRFIDVWAHYPFDYLVHVIGFAYKIPSLNAQGFPVEVIKPMFTFTDKNIRRTLTNCVPYVYWEENVREVLKLLMPIAKELEHKLAGYLHGESSAGGRENIVGQEASPVVQISYQLGNTDVVGGYDYGNPQVPGSRGNAGSRVSDANESGSDDSSSDQGEEDFD